jgi:hypothetical protein
MRFVHNLDGLEFGTILNLEVNESIVSYSKVTSLKALPKRFYV